MIFFFRFMRSVLVSLFASLVVVCAGCSTTTVEAARPTPAASQSRMKDLSVHAQEVVIRAVGLLKTRYRFGGKTPDEGLDCSGLVAHAYKEAVGLTLPGNAATIAKMSRKVDTAELKEGDLVFFNTRNKPRSHVGLYIGDGKFVHAENERKGVTISSMSEPYYASRFEDARTILH